MPVANRRYSSVREAHAVQAAEVARAELRRRHRVLVITIKSLLEAIEAKILTFDEAFLTHVLIEGPGQTLGKLLIPKLDTGLGLRALAEENPPTP